MSSIRRPGAEARRQGIAVILAVLAAVMTTWPGGGAADAADLYTFVDDTGRSFYTNIAGEYRARVRPPRLNAVTKRQFHAVAGAWPPFHDALQERLYEPVIVAAGEMFSLDPDIIRAVIRVESNYNAAAVSPKGAQGLMQLMPQTAHELGVSDPFDPVANIHGGVRYLRGLMERLNGNLSLALAAYNAGPARVTGRNQIPDIEETRLYVKRVLNYYKSLKGRNQI